ncbi:MAG: YggS family pyridoxal phosphate-dependent enzyme [Bacteroidetes bacterium]|nr:MAG: YggS family pyridoxal phosphate-dependent enzyme [Bacteroidota bacterium]
MAIFCRVNLIEEKYTRIKSELSPLKVKLVAVSKLQSIESIQALYNLGHRDFGENYVQECCEKHEKLPKDIHWHFIGHLQSNKVKYISPFIHLIHGVDSLKLLKEINKQAARCERIQSVLLQIHIASEETKFGFSVNEIDSFFMSADLRQMKNIQIEGLMGMATFSENTEIIRKEFNGLNQLFERIKKQFPELTNNFRYLSMGMTSDFKIAIEEGSNLVRIGSALFGERKKTST